ncbi:hypothetical protein ACSTS3_03640 [Aquimarina muelleri]|uniref:hypothetical protein n=1 Tax=Aquimarina muelleri TaxID=279356 RepID=UPI003F688429
MDVVNIFSIDSNKEIFGKKYSKEGLYGLFESVFEGLIVKKNNKYLYSINGSNFRMLKSRVENRLLEFLEERENNPPEIVQWKGRFERNEVFYKKNILGKDYELYSGGIDSVIWGFSILLDIIIESEKEDKSEILIFYSKRRSDFRKVKAKINLIRLLGNTLG